MSKLSLSVLGGFALGFFLYFFTFWFIPFSVNVIPQLPFVQNQKCSVSMHFDASDIATVTAVYEGWRANSVCDMIYKKEVAYASNYSPFVSVARDIPLNSTMQEMCSQYFADTQTNATIYSDNYSFAQNFCTGLKQ